MSRFSLPRQPGPRITASAVSHFLEEFDPTSEIPDQIHALRHFDLDDEFAVDDVLSAIQDALGRP